MGKKHGFTAVVATLVMLALTACGNAAAPTDSQPPAPTTSGSVLAATTAPQGPAGRGDLDKVCGLISVEEIASIVGWPKVEHFETLVDPVVGYKGRTCAYQNHDPSLGDWMYVALVITHNPDGDVFRRGYDPKFSAGKVVEPLSGYGDEAYVTPGMGVTVRWGVWSFSFGLLDDKPSATEAMKELAKLFMTRWPRQ